MTWLKQNWFKLVIAVAVSVVAIAVVMGVWISPWREESKLIWCRENQSSLTSEERKECMILNQIFLTKNQ